MLKTAPCSCRRLLSEVFQRKADYFILTTTSQKTIQLTKALLHHYCDFFKTFVSSQVEDSCANKKIIWCTQRHINVQSTFVWTLRCRLHFFQTNELSPFLNYSYKENKKNSLLITYGVSSMHRHGINIPLKKREIIRRCRFTCITARYWLIVTQ